MSDATPKKKSLSEISHLFLSSVRDNATGGSRPQRVPPQPQPTPQPTPQQPELTVDLTPEEFAHVTEAVSSPVDASKPRPRLGAVSAIIASHLNGKQFDRAKEYARHLAADGKRVGLIEVDAA